MPTSDQKPGPKVKHTHHVLAVRDLDAAASYFINKLGFERRFTTPGWEFLGLDSFLVMLGHCPDEVPAAKTHNHSYFAHVMLEDIAPVFADMQRRGAEFLFELEEKPWGFLEFGVVTPEGHRICFAQELDD